MDLKESLAARFEANLGRVRTVLGSYETIAAALGLDAASDVARSCVVLLHATFEDLLRSLAEWRLPTAAPEHLQHVPFPGMAPGKRFALNDLAMYRGQTVEDVIEEAVRRHLSRESFNNLGDTKSLLLAIGVERSVLDHVASPLAALMSRRHWIVHRLDRDEGVPMHETRSRSIEPSVVDAWLDAVQAAGQAILERV